MPLLRKAVCGVRLFCTSQFITYSHLSLTAVPYESVVKYTMKECTRHIQKETTLIYIFLNDVLVLLVQLQSVFINSREGDLQIAGLYGSTSVVNEKVHIHKITLGIILCTLINKSNVIRR